MLPIDDAVYPVSLRSAEEALVARRRREAGVDPRAPRLGLALSGGGLRSATFCLGFCQALARLGLLRRVDYLSTVSGGGYCGALIGGLFHADRGRSGAAPSDAPAPGADETEKTLADTNSPVIRWLRESGRYLAPNGSGDLLLAASTAFRNWFAINLVLLTFLFVMLVAGRLGLVGLRALLEHWSWTQPAAALERWLPLSSMPAILVFVFGAIPCAWAYWLTQRRAMAFVVVVFAVATAATWQWGSPSLARGVQVTGFVAFLPLALRLEVWWRGFDEETARRVLSRRLARSLLVTLALLSWSAVDQAGRALFDHLDARYWSWPAVASALGLASLISAARRVLPMLLARDRRNGLTAHLPLPLLAGLAAATLLGILASAVSASVWAVQRSGTDAAQPATALAWALGLTGLLSLAFAHTPTFLNLSSHHALYSARLKRTFLGASNPARRDPARRRVTEPVRGDDIELPAYAPHERGGPLHIVNVTVNETVVDRLGLAQRDRRGRSLAVGPCGLSLGRQHHALWKTRGEYVQPVAGGAPGAEQPFGSDGHDVERLSLGAWVAVSGAAFTTGLGSQTSWGLSVLAGLSNVRLGLWWDTLRTPSRGRAHGRLANAAGNGLRRLFPVQVHLLCELMARFHGPGRRLWYLSDGGHFENTGAYELIRRRLPLIVICDCGADPAYEWTDLANLVRKARTDFGAEVAFLSADSLSEHLPPAQRGLFGLPLAAPACLEPEPSGGTPDDARRLPCAYLARITYEDGERSLLIVIKPALRGDEPTDLLSYAASHQAFPQETTLDQFFDEAQWESYRKLGEHIGQAVLGPREAGLAPYETLLAAG